MPNKTADEKTWIVIVPPLTKDQDLVYLRIEVKAELYDVKDGVLYLFSQEDRHRHIFASGCWTQAFVKKEQEDAK